MQKPTATVVVGGTAAIVVAAAAAIIGVSVTQKTAPVVPVDCQELRGYLERDFAMRLRDERRAIWKDASAVVKGGLIKQKARNPKAAMPQEIEGLVLDLDKRASE